MQYYYENLKNRLPKDEALWQARRSYLLNPKRGETYAHPFFWSGFIPLGDMAPLRL